MSRFGEESRSRLLNFGIASILIAAVVAIYGQSLHFGAVRFDDSVYIAGSSHLQNGLSVDGLKWAFSSYFGS
ncbi:MAG: hypothetical protein JRJ05_02165, partial [Deltaproteobacteria bacterium]|nr:hypothetical protein [Deltaproteobacteria bacterium]